MTITYDPAGTAPSWSPPWPRWCWPKPRRRSEGGRCQHRSSPPSEYVAAGFMPMADGDLVWVAEGVPGLRVAIVPRAEISFNDGWHVQGLKGTGSCDYEVADVFVPAHRTFALFTRQPERATSPAFHMGLIAITAAGHAGWALGVARSMIDDVRELAIGKVRMGDPAPLANKAAFQVGLAHHEAMWRAARLFRDLYTGTQHAFIGEKMATDAAQVWLGLVKDPIGL